MSDCIFCKIVNGEIPCFKIYEDSKALAFLDISNDCNGHILVIPKKHCQNIMDCENLADVMAAVQKISKNLTNNCGFSGVNILNASGEGSEQSVFHLHFHILPRTKDDRIKVFPTLPKNETTLQEICERLKLKG